jgi:radical SAM protein with 4Fe4S-binding SPASM domain
MSKDLSPTICLLPVSSIAIHATGKIVRCHMSENEMGDTANGSILEQWDNEKFQTLRKQQLSGEWSEGCKNCKAKEEKGLTSKRKHWMTLDIFRDVWEKVDWNNPINNEIYHLDIAFNNLCNFKCLMCNSAYSNAWINDEKKLQGFFDSIYEKRTSSTWNREKWTLKSSQLEEILDRAKNLRRVEILGGEPFLVPEFLEFLKLMKDRGLTKQTEIMITTNGSVITEEKLNLLEDFKYVNINLSLDATGSYFSYMRSAGIIDWPTIVQKASIIKDWCEKARKGTYKLNINGTFQLINILDLKDFIEFIIYFYGWDKREPSSQSKFRHSFEHRVLFGPSYLRAECAPNILLEESLDQINFLKSKYQFLENITEKRYLDDIYKLLINAKTSPLEEREKKVNIFRNYINEIDRIRKTDFSKVAPRIYEEIFNRVR